MGNTNDKTAPASIVYDRDFAARLAAYPGGKGGEYRALIRAIDKHGDARAEEARRETKLALGEGVAHSIARAADEVATLKDRLAYVQRQNSELEAALAELNAQRTAGGDAVANAAVPGTDWRDALRRSGYADHHGLIAFTPGQLEHFVSMLKSQPVAEAAAQADDARMHDVVTNLREYASNPGYSHNDYADTMREAAKTIEGLRAAIYHYAGLIPAAPTAQPTPPKVVLELPDGDSRVAKVWWQEMRGSELHVCISVDAAQPTPAKTVEFDGIAAQPTLPDDERAAFEDWMAGDLPDEEAAVVVGRNKDGSYYDPITAKAWEATERAALRQPGANTGGGVNPEHGTLRTLGGTPRPWPGEPAGAPVPNVVEQLPTSEQIEKYIDYADAELGPECCDPWVEWCRSTLRAAQPVGAGREGGLNRSYKQHIALRGAAEPQLVIESNQSTAEDAMDSLMDPAIRIATLEATIRRLREDLAHERSRNTVLESTSRIEGQEIKRLKRLLTEATYGLAARKDGPSTARAIDKG